MLQGCKNVCRFRSTTLAGSHSLCCPLTTAAQQSDPHTVQFRIEALLSLSCDSVTNGCLLDRESALDLLTGPTDQLDPPSTASSPPRTGCRFSPVQSTSTFLKVSHPFFSCRLEGMLERSQGNVAVRSQPSSAGLHCFLLSFVRAFFSRLRFFLLKEEAATEIHGSVSFIVSADSQLFRIPLLIHPRIPSILSITRFLFSVSDTLCLCMLLHCLSLQ